MDEKNRIKKERLFETFKRNFRLTQLYAEYLSRYPEVITEEMVNALTADGEITKKEAVVALLSEIFALNFDDYEDRRIIMDYLNKSVRLLDRKKYESNPYYVNVSPEPVKDGDWEIKWEEYKPYQAVIASDMIIEEDFTEIPPLGFFTEGFRFPAILEDGNEWMTLTPVDLDTCEEAIEAAHGRVITFGLGLGYYAYMASEKPEVESVTVVELSEKVIKLFKKHLLPKMPNGQKIKIVNCDAFEYAEKIMPNEHFDLAFVDTWRDASDGAPMYQKMKALEGLSVGTKFLYWIENFLISKIRADKASALMDDETLNYEEILEELTNI